MIRSSVYAGSRLIEIEVILSPGIYASNVLTMYEILVQHQSDRSPVGHQLVGLQVTWVG
jgi:hypothetical protein